MEQAISATLPPEELAALNAWLLIQTFSTLSA